MVGAEFIAEDEDFRGRLETETYLVTPDRNDRNPDVIADDYLLIQLAAQDQHGQTSL
jgi:hypothetical protein